MVSLIITKKTSIGTKSYETIQNIDDTIPQYYELDVSGDINTSGVYNIDGNLVLSQDTLGHTIQNSSDISFLKHLKPLFSLFQ